MVHRAIWSALILVLIGVVSAGTWSLLRKHPAVRRTITGGSPRLSLYGSVPDFSFIERTGRKVQREELLGKIWVVNFIYTHCPDTCPLQTAEMANLQADLATETDVRLVSITVDPNRDTPEVLSRYANRFRADANRWLFLTGEKGAIYRFAIEGLRLPVIDPNNQARIPGGRQMPLGSLGSRQGQQIGQGVSERRARTSTRLGALRWLLDPAPAVARDRKTDGTLLHSSRFVLVDRRARIRSYYDSTVREALQQLREDIKALLQEG